MQMQAEMINMYVAGYLTVLNDKSMNTNVSMQAAQNTPGKIRLAVLYVNIRMITRADIRVLKAESRRERGTGRGEYAEGV